MDTEENVVIAVRFNNQIRWFQSERDLWILDSNQWRNEFINAGYHVPEFDQHYRFGLKVVNEVNATYFLESMCEFEIHKDVLSLELIQKFPDTTSWWDVQALFPIMFVNFDACEVAGFYSEGVAMERYLPEGWKGEFIDFATEYPEDIFPSSEKFWVNNGSDLLALLNARGAKKSV
ncbi:group-specific protein [Acinetobacter sp. CFCC 10889]|uniref:group-specific protein n=1 Tax=Acinetobacter sp. CFCC 10889 TaxID=1775557 RepID=UPI000DCFFFD3|nr:group-specific protein [Acinetobacter sp. CFCC 10889]